MGGKVGCPCLGRCTHMNQPCRNEWGNSKPDGKNQEEDGVRCGILLSFLGLLQFQSVGGAQQGDDGVDDL